MFTVIRKVLRGGGQQQTTTTTAAAAAGSAKGLKHIVSALKYAVKADRRKKVALRSSCSSQMILAMYTHMFKFIRSLCLKIQHGV